MKWFAWIIIKDGTQRKQRNRHSKDHSRILDYILFVKPGDIPDKVKFDVQMEREKILWREDEFIQQRWFLHIGLCTDHPSPSTNLFSNILFQKCNIQEKYKQDHVHKFNKVCSSWCEGIKPQCWYHHWLMINSISIGWGTIRRFISMVWAKGISRLISSRT